MPSKMPCYTYSIPTTACVTGSKLKKVEGSACSRCYCDGKGNYRYPTVTSAQARRLALLLHWIDNDPTEWVNAMAFLINGDQYFRWHDSGDVINKQHWDMICGVSLALPNTELWLPTHEVWVYKKPAPENLVVRLSATMIDGAPSRSAALTSTIHRHKAPIGFPCPAPKQGNECGTCRACWNKDVKNVSYAYH